MEKQNNRGVTKSPAPVGRHGSLQGSDVTTYDLKEMSPVLVDQLDLAKYLREHSEEETEETTE